MRLGPAVIFTALVLGGSPFSAGVNLSPRSALAATSVELTVADLVAKSTLVIAGTPLERKAVWQQNEGARGRRIVTYTRVRIDRLIDGTASQRPPEGGMHQEVWVRTLGGEVGDIGQHVDGEAVLPIGKSMVLFLRETPDGTHAVVGMSQGEYPLEVPENGAPARLSAPPGLGRLVARVTPPGVVRPAARLVLTGRTLDEATALIAAERRAQTP